MFLGILVLLTALTISSVAIYYSVAGLVAIFAAAAIPIMIMGTALEIAKLVTTVWLHKNWKNAVWWLKTYLSMAVVVLMLITSMGIFGYLSKAHIQQTAQNEQNIQEVTRLDTEIQRQQALVTKYESELTSYENKGTDTDSGIQSQIDKEQTRIDSAYTRIQPSIDEQNKIIDDETARLGGGAKIKQDRVAEIDQQLALVQQYSDSNEVKKLQSLIGVKADGNFGPGTTAAVAAFKDKLGSEKQTLGQQIADEQKSVTSTVIDAARAEIKRLRGVAEQQIADSNALINRLRDQLGKTDATSNDNLISDTRQKISDANKTLDDLTNKKFTLETEGRKLEAEVGPVKYLAEMVYGSNTDTGTLEKAVRFVIIMIIFVFDPLAVLLLIASQYTFSTLPPKISKTPIAEPPVRKTRTVKPKPVEVVKIESVVEPIKRQPRKRIPKVVEEPVVDAEPAIDYDDAEYQARAARLAATEAHDAWKLAKKTWKEENPDLNLKSFKDDYVRGKISDLPWAAYVNDNENYVQNSEQGSNTLWKQIRDNANGSDNNNNAT
jgi:peptidoglycan hydrolase-like protein with peptidoglycan-binding domain